MTYFAARIHELHDGPMKALDVTGGFLATGGADGAVRLLAADGRHVGTSQAHRDLVNAVAIGSKGMVASASRDRSVRLFDPDKERSYVVGEHEHWVMAIAWSGDGSMIATGSEDGTVGVWSPDGATARRISLGSPINGVDWRGDVIAAVGGDRSLHLLDADGNTKRTVEGAEQLLWSVAISPDTQRIAWAGRDRRLRIVGIDDSTSIVVPAHDAQIWSVAWNESGDRIATASADGSVAVWSATGEPLQRIRVATWARGARFQGVELYVATESGDLHVFADDGLPDATPPTTKIPESPASCVHWDPQFEDGGAWPRCAECGSLEEARLCVTCGHIGCCESQLAHATKHWLDTGHPTTIPVPARDFSWQWCYEDDMYIKRTEPTTS